MHIETLAQSTRDVLDKLAGLEVMNSFYLSGGTALALHLGHRESEDLDFFSQKEFDPQVLQQQLEKSFKLTEIAIDQDTLNCFIGNVKLQFLHCPYQLISPTSILGGIVISSVTDIACTKLITVSSRGSKKDFVDLYFILKIYSLSELFALLPKKYTGVNYNLLHILKSLVFFETAEEQPMPKMHIEVSWPEVKRSLSLTIKNFKL